MKKIIAAAMMFLLAAGCSADRTAPAVQDSSEEETAVYTEETKQEKNPVQQDEDTEDVHTAEEKLSAAEVTFVTDQLEYSNKTVDPLTLIRCDDPEIAIEALNEINLSGEPEQSVTYRLLYEGVSREVTQTFRITDTHAPKIELKEETVRLEYGTEYDPLGNIVSVSDPVDGELAYDPEGSGQPGTYYMEGKLDAKTPGTYVFAVYAADRNANTGRVSFEVVVGTLPDRSVAADYVVNVNTGKFHLPGCRSVPKIKKENRNDVHCTRDELIAQGYEPCKNCNP